MKPRLYLLWIQFCTFFSYVCNSHVWIDLFFWNICHALCFVCVFVCTCTNQLVLSTEVTRLNFLNSIVMGQINQCGFQSHVAIDRYCIFLEINTFELSWVKLKLEQQPHIITMAMFHLIVYLETESTSWKWYRLSSPSCFRHTYNRPIYTYKWGMHVVQLSWV